METLRPLITEASFTILADCESGNLKHISEELVPQTGGKELLRRQDRAHPHHTWHQDCL